MIRNRYHLLAAMKVKLLGIEPLPAAPRKVQERCERILDVVWDTRRSERLMLDLLPALQRAVNAELASELLWGRWYEPSASPSGYGARYLADQSDRSPATATRRPRQPGTSTQAPLGRDERDEIRGTDGYDGEGLVGRHAAMVATQALRRLEAVPEPVVAQPIPVVAPAALDR